MKKLNLFVVLFVLLSLFVNPIFGSVEECIPKFNMILNELTKYNMQTIKDTFKYAELYPYVKESCFTGYQLTMYSNAIYAIIMVGDNNVTDMDVYVFDSENKQIIIESANYLKFKDAIIIYYKPTYTGKHTIIFHLKGIANGTNATVSYGLAYK